MIRDTPKNKVILRISRLRNAFVGIIETMDVFDLWVLMDQYEPPTEILFPKANIKIINNNHGHDFEAQHENSTKNFFVNFLILSITFKRKMKIISKSESSL